ncbi:DUF4384 domain-containing protein [Hyalangium rubrum]|uniref:DUF4384 domain-containing protein n=1 Tax=Hyalangium rubrum TaxID=3103134 RepID=A0ABU5HEH4_9BACT|nr:DUF4384 domain-containing protein [Hyalangium sp. s54d21]MDY7231872.1 DUF4384 domain-containing protein [Hyalangium sp. s54d21]
MNSTPLPPSPRGPHCPPAALLEAMSAGEAAPESTRVHVEGCPDCSGQLKALTAGSEAFMRARPPELFLRQVERRAASAPRPGLRRWLPLLGACVPVLALLVLVPRLVAQNGVREKGDGFRVVAARAGGAPELLGADAQVRPGDALRFAYEAPEAGHLLVLELDGRGAASVFYPYGAATSAPLGAGQREFLPGSVVLDDAPGPEWLLAVFSPRPLEAAPLLEALRTQAGRAEPTLSCPDCRVSTLRLQKRP